MKISEADQVLFAALLSLVGPRSSQDGQDAFGVFGALFFQKTRQHRIPKVLALLPPDRDRLLHLVKTIHEYSRVTKKNVATERCQIDQVVAVILQVPRPADYIRVLHERGLSALGVMFHPGTLERMKKEVRGLFSGTADYWSKTKGQLRIVND